MHTKEGGSWLLDHRLPAARTVGPHVVFVTQPKLTGTEPFRCSTNLQGQSNPVTKGGPGLSGHLIPKPPNNAPSSQDTHPPNSTPGPKACAYM